MGSKHEITIHTKPLLFFIILSAKKTIAYCCTLKSTHIPHVVQAELFSLHGHRTQFFSPLYIEQWIELSRKFVLYFYLEEIRIGWQKISYNTTYIIICKCKTSSFPHRNNTQVYTSIKYEYAYFVV